MAAVNLAIRDRLSLRGSVPITLDLSARSLSRAWHVRAKRGLRIAGHLVRFLSLLIHARRVSLYLGVSGHYGQVYDLLFLMAARLAGSKVFLHHHSFVYITTRRPLAYLLTRIAGKSTCHIVLCECMGRGLSKQYSVARTVHILSNAAFCMLGNISPRFRVQLALVGFLGNIEKDKGIFEFLQVMERIKDRQMPIRGVIAGPFRNRQIEDTIRREIVKLGNVEYVGPMYGEDKARFFDEVDVLLYPTENDAEPLTVLEAMSRATPVIATAIGCLPEILPASAGVTIEATEDFAEKALSHLVAWWSEPMELARKSKGASEQFLSLHQKSETALNKCFEALLADP